MERSMPHQQSAFPALFFAGDFMSRKALEGLKCIAIASHRPQTCLSRPFSAARQLRHLQERSGHRFVGKSFWASASSQNDDSRFFKPAKSDEEWLKLDEKVNEYPCHRTFKAIGIGGKEFADSMVEAVERATNSHVDRRVQVVQRPSKEGKYTSVSVRSVSMQSGKQVLSVFKEMKQSGGDRLKFIM